MHWQGQAWLGVELANSQENLQRFNQYTTCPAVLTLGSCLCNTSHAVQKWRPRRCESGTFENIIMCSSKLQALDLNQGPLQYWVIHNDSLLLLDHTTGQKVNAHGAYSQLISSREQAEYMHYIPLFLPFVLSPLVLSVERLTHPLLFNLAAVCNVAQRGTLDL